MNIFFRLTSIIQSFQSEIVAYSLNLETSSILMMLICIAIFAVALSIRLKDKIYSLITYLVDIKSRKKDLSDWTTHNNSDSILKSLSGTGIGMINLKFFLVYISFWILGYLPIFIVGKMFALQLIVIAFLIAASNIKWTLIAGSIYCFLPIIFIYLTTIASYLSGINFFEGLEPDLLTLFNIDLQSQTFAEIANSTSIEIFPYCSILSAIVIFIFVFIRVFFSFIINSILKMIALITYESSI